MADRPGPFSEDDLIVFIRGLASSELSEQIEAEMALNSELQAEIALMRGLKPALTSEEGANPPGEFGWRRLEAEIRRETSKSRVQQRSRHTPIWRAAAAVFGIAALGQAAYITVQSRDVSNAVYRTASDPAEAYVLGIAFSPNAKANDIGILLGEAKGQLIGGPSALGLYRVTFASSEALTKGRALFEASPLIDLVAEE